MTEDSKRQKMTDESEREALLARILEWGNRGGRRVIVAAKWECVVSFGQKRFVRIQIQPGGWGIYVHAHNSHSWGECAGNTFVENLESGLRKIEDYLQVARIEPPGYGVNCERYTPAYRAIRTDYGFTACSCYCIYSLDGDRIEQIDLCDMGDYIQVARNEKPWLNIPHSEFKAYADEMWARNPWWGIE